jgi:hypothetical protein
MKRYRVAWSGGGLVGPGLSTFYEKPDSNVGGADAIFDFFDSLKSAITTAVTITVPSSGDIIEDTTGELVGTWSESGTGGAVVGTSAENFVMGTGARVRWATGGIHGGHRVNGATYIAPLQISSFAGSGALADPFVVVLEASADALLDALPGLCIWSRPRTGLAGASYTIESAVVPDKVSWLRSRRV